MELIQIATERWVPLKTLDFDEQIVISMFRVKDNMLKYLINTEKRDDGQDVKEGFLGMSRLRGQTHLSEIATSAFNVNQEW
jgi:hypothetical protein